MRLNGRSTPTVVICSGIQVPTVCGLLFAPAISRVVWQICIVLHDDVGRFLDDWSRRLFSENWCRNGRDVVCPGRARIQVVSRRLCSSGGGSNRRRRRRAIKTFCRNSLNIGGRWQRPPVPELLRRSVFSICIEYGRSCGMAMRTSTSWTGTGAEIAAPAGCT